MKPCDWAAIGFRLLAICLFVQAIFCGVSAGYCAIVWMFAKPTFNDFDFFTSYTAVAALICALQSTAFGYWYWFGAEGTASPHGLESENQVTVDPIAPLMTLAVAVWGMLGLTPATQRIVGLVMHQQKTLLSISEWLENPVHGMALRYSLIMFVAAMICTFAPRTIVGILLWCTPGGGCPMQEPNEATST